jgi:hypothetical protein
MSVYLNIASSTKNSRTANLHDCADRSRLSCAIYQANSFDGRAVAGHRFPDQNAGIVEWRVHRIRSLYLSRSQSGRKVAYDS